MATETADFFLIFSMKKHNSFQSLVYSTNPDAIKPAMNEEQTLLSAAAQQLRVRLDKKQRGGKVVTLITGFEGSEAELATLGKTLKTKCGTGGSAKGGEIIVQGDNRQKVLALLKEMGYGGSK